MTQTILLADDSVTIQKVVELTFMEGDYQVVALGNGADAAQRLADVQPDLVIADVHMPGLNGYDLCRRVKEWRPDTPVILLVGTFEPFDMEQAAASGADSHLKKPFDSQDLVQRAADLLERAAPSRPAEVPPPIPAMDGGEPEWALAEGDDTDSLHVQEALGSAEPQDLYEPDTWSAPPPHQATAEPPPAATAQLWKPAPAAAAAEPEPSWNQPRPAPAAPLETFSFSPPAPQARALPPLDAPSAASGGAPDRPLTDDEVDRIARRVVELIGDRTIRDVSWEVIPDLAEVIIKDRIRELEAQVE